MDLSDIRGLMHRTQAVLTENGFMMKRLADGQVPASQVLRLLCFPLFPRVKMTGSELCLSEMLVCVSVSVLLVLFVSFTRFSSMPEHVGWPEV